MPKDYKNTPRSGQKRSGKSKPQNKSNLPGWLVISGILVLGIVIGLIGPRLFGIAQHGWKTTAPTEPTHASSSAKKKTDTQSKTEKTHFDFYKLLPNFQVVIPKEDKSVQSGASDKPVTAPGNYVVQVASFQEYNAADELNARLALLGLDAHIETVTTNNGETWNRVRLGPFDNLKQLNRVRKTLAEHQFKPLLITVNQ